MAKRRHQDPKPKREGNFWYIRIWENSFAGGVSTRRRKRIKLGPASMNQREVMKTADEVLRPINQGLITIGSAVNFGDYVQREYIPGNLPLLASTTQACYQGAIRKHLEPSFGAFSLRELNSRTLKKFFSGMANQGIPYPTIVKVRDALSSILRAAVEDELLVKNPMEGLKLPPDRRPRRGKPFISPEQFNSLVQLIPEPSECLCFGRGRSRQTSLVVITTIAACYYQVKTSLGIYEYLPVPLLNLQQDQISFRQGTFPADKMV